MRISHRRQFEHHNKAGFVALLVGEFHPAIRPCGPTVADERKNFDPAFPEGSAVAGFNDLFCSVPVGPTLVHYFDCGSEGRDVFPPVSPFRHGLVNVRQTWWSRFSLAEPLV